MPHKYHKINKYTNKILRIIYGQTTVQLLKMMLMSLSQKVTISQQHFYCTYGLKLPPYEAHLSCLMMIMKTARCYSKTEGDQFFLSQTEARCQCIGICISAVTCNSQYHSVTSDGYLLHTFTTTQDTSWWAVMVTINTVQCLGTVGRCSTAAAARTNTSYISIWIIPVICPHYISKTLKHSNR